MKTPTLAALPLLAVVAASACSSATRSAASGSPSSAQAAVQAASVPAARCTAVVRGVDVSSWESVAADGFTFCLPADWTGRDGTARQGSTTLSWGSGSPAQPRMAILVSNAQRVGEPASHSELPPGSEVRRLYEVIDGRNVILWRNIFERTYYVGVQWESPRVWLLGDTPAARDADLMLNIIRTVRFTTE